MVSRAERKVQNKYESIVNNLCVDKVFTRRMVKYYIAKAKLRILTWDRRYNDWAFEICNR